MGWPRVAVASFHEGLFSSWLLSWVPKVTVSAPSKKRPKRCVSWGSWQRLLGMTSPLQAPVEDACQGIALSQQRQVGLAGPQVGRQGQLPELIGFFIFLIPGRSFLHVAGRVQELPLSLPTLCHHPNWDGPGEQDPSLSNHSVRNQYHHML